MPYAGEIAALLTALLWTGSALAFSHATRRIGSVYVNVVRLMGALILLSATVFLGNIPLRLSWAQFLFFAASGLVGLVFGDTYLFKSYEYNSARISTLIMSTAPALTAILAYLLLGEGLSGMGIAGMAVTLIGIALVVLENKKESIAHIPVSGRGIWYAFLGAVGQAGGLILAKEAFALGPANGFAATLVRVAAAVVVITPWNFLAGRFRSPVQVFRDNKQALWFTLLGTVLGPFLGITLSLISVSLTKVAIAATLMAVTPIMMLPTVRILFGERLTWRAILGAFVAVAGVALLFLR